MKWNSLSVFLCLLVVAKASEEEHNYMYFDDYLSSLKDDDPSILTKEEDLEGSGSLEEFKETPNLPLRTGFARSKDGECCSLGQLAGDKGYHCFVKFYAARTLLRNQNRAHNRKLGFYGRYSVPNYGTKLMNTFEQCVASRGMVFHKCCRLSAKDRRIKPHYDSVQRKRYELKMKKIRMPRMLEDDFIGV